MGHEYVELKNYNMAIECYRNAIDVSILATGFTSQSKDIFITLVEQLKIFNFKIQL